ncbi:hypothetical protein JOF56_008868 [Kibdelosporangium banguiense]|uniref:Uncharacterized protein n=1 Tax=Kibdelosporangium banguiense TaxID=1365924 RepID=A0ABS4TVU0_9PSEU|nr:hypothetical protein [Kibdelosporangium banguiense]MBP2328483.1 hypothetical protein [Kibdelosporangium banguiense]
MGKRIFDLGEQSWANRLYAIHLGRVSTQASGVRTALRTRTAAVFAPQPSAEDRATDHVVVSERLTAQPVSRLDGFNAGSVSVDYSAYRVKVQARTGNRVFGQHRFIASR